MEEKLKYNGFDFGSPLFKYLGAYGTEETMKCGNRRIQKIDLDLDPREIEASGYSTIEADADSEKEDHSNQY